MQKGHLSYDCPEKQKTDKDVKQKPKSDSLNQKGLFLRSKVQPMQIQFQDGPVFQLNSINKSCLFVEVKINGVKVNFFIDTGQYFVCILSSKTFELLENAPTQLGSVFNTMTVADGGIIKTYGKSSLSFQLGAVHLAKSYLELIDKFVELY